MALLANMVGAAERGTPSAIKRRVFVLTDISNDPDGEESVAQPFPALTAASKALM